MGFPNANIYETWEYIWEKETVALFSGAYKEHSSKNKESESAEIKTIFVH